MLRSKRGSPFHGVPSSLFNPREPTDSAARDFAQDGTVRRDELDVQGHLPHGVGGAAQARVVAADAMLDAVEHGLGDLVAAHVTSRDLGDGLVQSQRAPALSGPFDTPPRAGVKSPRDDEYEVG